MATTTPVRILSQPGIKRDGTLLEGPEYKDGLWCRFSRRGLPTKIGGYKAITSQLPEIVRGMDAYFFGGTNYLHIGSASYLQQIQSDQFGNPGGQYDRTPSGFAANANNLWQFDTFYNSATGQTVLVANGCPSVLDITNATETPVYYGPVTSPTALVASGMPNVAGGILAVSPYLIGYSNYGRIDISPINAIGSGITVNSAYVSDQKIVKGLALRNGSGGPAALFWSLSELVIATYNPALLAGIPFNFNTISSDISVLSPASIVEFDGIYYWAEIDHFSMFNGIVLELPNNQNHDFFFNNLNFAYRNKVFAIKIQAACEIWWCFPLGSSTECNHAVIYNTYLKVWYDTPLPGSGRSAGASPRTFNKPYMTDLVTTSTGYTLWQHETGLDQNQNGQVTPIESYFTTTEISPVISAQAKDKAFRVDIVEQDLGQVGPMTLNILGRANASCSQAILATRTLTTPATTYDQQITLAQVNARLLAFQFISNTPGGNFYLGNTIAHIEETDGRKVQ
jgi:hypothetical protein